MTADSIKDIQHLKAIGRICAEALRKMQAQVRVGMTTRELDEIGRAFLKAEGARSASRPVPMNGGGRRGRGCSAERRSGRDRRRLSKGGE